MTRKFLQNLEIPLPPLEVQREIVAEVEGYQRVIDGARDVLNNYRPHIPVDPEWPMVPLKEVCLIQRGKFSHRPRNEPRFFGGAYVQQSPWLSIANKQLELMGRYMTELGLTPASRSRIATIDPTAADGPMTIRRIILVAPDRSGTSGDTPRLQAEGTLVISGDDANL